MINNLLGSNLFTGVVEDTGDPLRTNRVRVRCHGFHNEDRNLLPTEELPWFHVAISPDNGIESGIGSKHNMQEGQFVVGVFIDGNRYQEGIVLGCIANLNINVPKNLSNGFTDATGQFPIDGPDSPAIVSSENLYNSSDDSPKVDADIIHDGDQGIKPVYEGDHDYLFEKPDNYKYKAEYLTPGINVAYKSTLVGSPGNYVNSSQQRESIVKKKRIERVTNVKTSFANAELKNRYDILIYKPGYEKLIPPVEFPSGFLLEKVKGLPNTFTSSVLEFVPSRREMKVKCELVDNFRNSETILDLHGREIEIEKFIRYRPSGKFFSQPNIPYQSEYIHNKVYQSNGGHLEEFDDTPGAERYHRWHPSGTFVEIQQNGTRVNKIVGNNYEIVIGDEQIYVAGRANIVAEGEINIRSNGTINVHSEGNIQAWAKKDVTVEVGENLSIVAQENIDISCKNFNLKVKEEIQQIAGTDFVNEAGYTKKDTSGKHIIDTGEFSLVSSPFIGQVPPHLTDDPRVYNGFIEIQGASVASHAEINYKISSPFVDVYATDGNISLRSKENLNIVTKNDLTFNTENVFINAYTNVEMRTDQGNIVVTSGNDVDVLSINDFKIDSDSFVVNAFNNAEILARKGDIALTALEDIYVMANNEYHTVDSYHLFSTNGIFINAQGEVTLISFAGLDDDAESVISLQGDNIFMEGFKGGRDIYYTIGDAFISVIGYDPFIDNGQYEFEYNYIEQANHPDIYNPNFIQSILDGNIVQSILDGNITQGNGLVASSQIWHQCRDVEDDGTKDGLCEKIENRLIDKELDENNDPNDDPLPAKIVELAFNLEDVHTASLVYGDPVIITGHFDYRTYTDSLTIKDVFSNPNDLKDTVGFFDILSSGTSWKAYIRNPNIVRQGPNVSIVEKLAMMKEDGESELQIIDVSDNKLLNTQLPLTEVLALAKMKDMLGEDKEVPITRGDLCRQMWGRPLNQDNSSIKLDDLDKNLKILAEKLAEVLEVLSKNGIMFVTPNNGFRGMRIGIPKIYQNLHGQGLEIDLRVSSGEVHTGATELLTDEKIKKSIEEAGGEIVTTSITYIKVVAESN